MATSIKLNEALQDRVQYLAETKRRSPHWILCEAVREYVAREESLEAFKQQALASWTAYQETGQHLTGQEVQDWLSTWGTDATKHMPKCHK